MTISEKPRRLASSEALFAAGLVPEARRAQLQAVSARYATALTPALAALIDRADPNDPIALQFVPDARELIVDPAEDADPIGDDLKSPVKGLVHRYPDRVLMKLVSVCAVYCRFCFRRERVGPGGEAMSAGELEAAFAYIRARPAIWEVVLTGGDPLMLSPRRIGEVGAALAAIEHVKALRWHTRLPIAAPERVTRGMARALGRIGGKTAIVALHANHPVEITPEVCAALRRLIEAGVMLVSQSVLLRNVNDDVETLERLMRAFVEAGVKPYYLHHPDLAPGTAHWRLPIETGQALMRDLRARLSGVAMPTYVLDIPGAHGKVPIGPQSIRPDGPGRYVVSDPAGGEHLYLDRLEGDARA